MTFTHIPEFLMHAVFRSAIRDDMVDFVDRNHMVERRHIQLAIIHQEITFRRRLNQRTLDLAFLHCDICQAMPLVQRLG